MSQENNNNPESNQGLAEDQGDHLNSRLERYGKAVKRSREMAKYLAGIGDHFRFMKLADCGSSLTFHHYFTVGLLRLVKAFFCKNHLLCPMCAIRRGGRQLRKYKDRYESLLKQAAAGGVNLHPQLVTLTIKNREDLLEAVTRLQHGLKILGQRARDKKRGWSKCSEWAHVLGVCGSIEVTNKGNGWHAHTHLFCLANKILDSDKISLEWHQITGDSFIIDIQEIDPTKDALKEFCEVFKYAMKFSELTLELNYHAAQVLARKRLFFATGLFFGIPEETQLTDDPLLDLPYIEMLFNYSDGAGYSLKSFSPHNSPLPLIPPIAHARGGEGASEGLRKIA